MVKYKQQCSRCKKYVTVTRRQNYVTCYDCQKKEFQQEIKDPKMKKFFDLPEKFYKENAFLRDIKLSYLRYGRLSDKQVEAFKKTVVKMKEGK